MPQMVALFNGMGGGSAAAIGAVELLRFSGVGAAPSMTTLVLGVLGALIGSVSLSGSVIARSEEHTSELQSLMRISYAVFCLKKKIKTIKNEASSHTYE